MDPSTTRIAMIRKALFSRFRLSRRAALSPLPTGLIALWTAMAAGGAQAQVPVLDLAELAPDPGRLTRVHGAVGSGIFGVPVAGPGDLDGDGLNDYAVAYMRANPLGRSRAGEVDVIFGSGAIGGTIDTAVDQARVLRIAGDVVQETAGAEIWIDDVTGDGVADLLVGRQNFTPGTGRIGAGALSIIVGGPELRRFSAGLVYLDLRSPPAQLQVFTLVGRSAGDRLGIWMRTGDVDGDGVADFVVGADGEEQDGAVNAGAVYLVRGGPHLAANQTVDLAAPAELDGRLARLHPPPGSTDYHVGATCLLADLDGNGRAELLASAALNRSGASIPPLGGVADPTGGSPRGTVYIAWDDNFAQSVWPAGWDLDLTGLPGASSVLDGGAENRIFGEEVVGGADFDGDGRGDLFVGDFQTDLSPLGNRPLSGVGYVFYDAASLRGLRFTLDEPPSGLRIGRILGPSAGSIGADTAALGDFNGDGLGDLLFGSPHDRPRGRISAGSIHLLYGRPGGWPELVDLAAPPPPSEIVVTHIQGARGGSGTDSGDTLCYSAAAGDLDRDGLTDILTNEMLGNGVAPAAVDVGNLLVIGGRSLTGAPPPPAAGSALFAAFLSHRPPARSSRLTVSNVVVPPGLQSEFFETGRPSLTGALEFYLFGQDGSLWFHSTENDPGLGQGLNPFGGLEPGRTFTVELGELLMAAGAEPDRKFDGYLWIVANFDAAAGTCSIIDEGAGGAVRNFDLTPAVGQGRSGTAGIPLRERD